MNILLFCRICGGIFIIAASLTASFLLSSGAKKRLYELTGFLSLIERIRLEIDCFSRPLDEIYRSSGDMGLDACGFEDALPRLGFFEALEEVRARLSISEEEYALLRGFSERLGQGYREGQLAACDYYINALRDALSAYSSELPKKLRLCRSLCLLLGVSVIILLI